LITTRFDPLDSARNLSSFAQLTLLEHPAGDECNHKRALVLGGIAWSVLVVILGEREMDINLRG
jgi:hypothetical protein